MNNVSKKNESNCIGCGTCVNVCPKGCIVLKENERGFLIPVVDTNECINCGLCLKYCEKIFQSSKNNIYKCYAGISKDFNVLKKSTSGGIFAVIAQKILSNGMGVVYGCAWKNLKASHIRITELSELNQLLNSKYIQSDTVNVFKSIKEDLKNNRIVIFSGTGCQISAIKTFIGVNYDNLLTIEVACHGVPSPGLFEKYINYKEKEAGKKIISYNFRNKNKHKTGEHHSLKIKYEDNTEKYFYANEDPYYSSFLEGKILRNICYNCSFKKENREADITLCDFWGIEHFDKKFPAKNGVSAIIINSEKGLQLIDSIKNELILKETKFEDIYRKNKSLIQSTNKEKKVDYSINDENLINNLIPKPNLKKFIKNHIPGPVKYFLKRIR